MSTLHDHLSDYLAMRRALGFKLERDERLLPQFIDYLHEQDERRITTAHALAWATLAGGSDPWRSRRLRVVRHFARYLHQLDPAHEVPPTELLPSREQRATPYLYSAEQIISLMDAAGTLWSNHRIATYRTFIGLLAVTGVRLGEAIALDVPDFDAPAGVLTVRKGKFGKSRELPLHDSTVAALASYLRREDRPPSTSPALFISTRGTRLEESNVKRTFRLLRDRAGLEPRSPGCRPRLHCLRHTFAVQTLLDAYRSGDDVGSRLAALSTYLGHVDPGNTYWYLQAAPELLALAGERLERYQQGGER